VCACLVALQWARGGAALSDAMLACEIVVFGLQVRLRVHETYGVHPMATVLSWVRK
jgi:hypothetical protein